MTASTLSPSMLTACSRNDGAGPDGTFVEREGAAWGQPNGSREECAGELDAHESSSSRIARTGGVSNFSSAAAVSAAVTAAAAAGKWDGNLRTLAATPKAAITARQVTKVLFRSGFVMLFDHPVVQFNLGARQPVPLGAQAQRSQFHFCPDLCGF